MAFQFPGVSHRHTQYRRSAVIFAQGAPCVEVMYLQQGSVKLSVLSSAGKEAIVSVLQPGDFFGEGCLAGQQAHIATAVAVNPSTVVVIDKKHMVEMLHTHPELNEQFLGHMLSRIARSASRSVREDRQKRESANFWLVWLSLKRRSVTESRETSMTTAPSTKIGAWD
jgi:CRP-like cAMP-binding protein